MRVLIAILCLTAVPFRLTAEEDKPVRQIAYELAYIEIRTDEEFVVRDRKAEDVLEAIPNFRQQGQLERYVISRGTMSKGGSCSFEFEDEGRSGKRVLFKGDVSAEIDDEGRIVLNIKASNIERADPNSQSIPIDNATSAQTRIRGEDGAPLLFGGMRTVKTETNKKTEHGASFFIITPRIVTASPESQDATSTK